RRGLSRAFAQQTKAGRRSGAEPVVAGCDVGCSAMRALHPLRSKTLQGMIRKSAKRFSEKIMLKQESKAR
ncbi:MAG: hypothetical protein ACK463_00110, partial [Bradyrhizobium sp.]